MIWLAHIGFDRALGYGLKYATGSASPIWAGSAILPIQIRPPRRAVSEFLPLLVMAGRSRLKDGVASARL